MRSLKMLVVALGLGTVSLAHAFSVAPLNHAQQQSARQQIKAQLPKGAKVESIKFGFGKTPTGFIGTGFEHATVKVKEGSTVKKLDFTVSPGMAPGKANVWAPTTK
jgi:hypothetical protein